MGEESVSATSPRVTSPRVGSAPSSTRVDQALVAAGLARSRAVAQAYVREQRVRRGGTIVRKPSEPIGAGEQLEVVGEPEPWVGRAAHKLLAALAAFEPTLGVAGRRCLDIGASTGGFTQVLLSRGATSVTALDVGHGQLAPVLKADPRVDERSGTSIRDIDAADLGGRFGLVVADLSFISLRLVLDRVAAMLDGEGDAVLLIKPQFEVGRHALGKTGVVRSDQQRAEAVARVLDTARDQGLHPHGLIPSPMTGATGNQEYLVWLTARPDGMMSAMEVTEALERVL